MTASAPTPDWMEQLVVRIRSHEPLTDIRIDQCDIARIYCGMRMIVVENRKLHFRAIERLLGGPSVFDRDLVLSEVIADTFEAVVDAVMAMIRRPDPT
jgi:hypothetical protein